MLQNPRDNPDLPPAPDLPGNPDLPPMTTPVPGQDIPTAPHNNISPAHGNDFPSLPFEDERLDDDDLADDTSSHGDFSGR